MTDSINDNTPPAAETTSELAPKRLDTYELADAKQLCDSIRAQVRQVFIGQDQLLDEILASILACGHVLVESNPGLGKTLLVKTLAQVLGLSSNRIQFTPDLMPADITGSHVFNMIERKFEFQKGPIFTQFLLADEINRSPAKTHAALLEAMAEGHVTLDGNHYTLDQPFIVVATQNPIENEGTYNLPEAALDRFMIKIRLNYPNQHEEEHVLRCFLSGNSPQKSLHTLEQVCTQQQLHHLQHLASHVHVSESIVSYITAITRSTRNQDYLYVGASPRASIAMLQLARVHALFAGRSYVIPEDVTEACLPTLRHRVSLSPEAEIEGRDIDDIITDILQAIPVPRINAQ